jgi:hypothetical protein
MENPAVESILDIDIETIDSVALRRLIEEVRRGELTQTGAYNRVYHRHNR